MITALDTNIIVAYADSTHEDHTRAYDAFLSIAGSSLIISPFVYGELHANPGFNPETLEEHLGILGIRVEKTLDEAIWSTAGKAFRSYALRRKQMTGELPRHILPDFLIGAHALLSKAQLLTLDMRTYRVAFPGLELVSV